MSTQTLHDTALDRLSNDELMDWACEARDELRRLHADNEKLFSALSDITFALDALGWKRLGVRLDKPHQNAKALLANILATTC